MDPETPETPETPSEVKATPEDVRGSGSSSDRKFASDKPTMAEIRRLKQPNQRSVAILLDSKLAHQMDEVAAEIEKLEKRRGQRISDLADGTGRKLQELIEQLDEMETEAKELTVTFTFQDIGRRAYDELIRQHPPSDDERKEYKDAGGEGVLAYSTSTFPPTLVSQCSLEPKISQAEAEAIFDEWSEGDLEMIFTTALLACKEPTSLPKSRAGTARTRASQQNLITVPSEESHTPDS
jgi:hypothetical protein